MKHNYQAPWGILLVVISSVTTILCVGIAAGIIFSNHSNAPWVALSPLALIVGGALFTIRSYTITPNAILIHRLCWTTQLPLTGLQSARFEPDAMQGSIRTFGNGGLFSFSGFFHNKTLGTYRAFVTDPSLTIVLRFPSHTVVISPATPEEFVKHIEITDLTHLNSENSSLEKNTQNVFSRFYTHTANCKKPCT